MTPKEIQEALATIEIGLTTETHGWEEASAALEALQQHQHDLETKPQVAGINEIIGRFKLAKVSIAKMVNAWGVVGYNPTHIESEAIAALYDFERYLESITTPQDIRKRNLQTAIDIYLEFYHEHPNKILAELQAIRAEELKA